MQCQNVSGWKVAGVAACAALVSMALAYAAAWTAEKAMQGGLNSRGKVLGLAALQAAVGIGAGAGAIAARSKIGDTVAVPAGSVLISQGVAQGVGIAMLARQLPSTQTPAELPQPSDVGT